MSVLGLLPLIMVSQNAKYLLFFPIILFKLEYVALALVCSANFLHVSFWPTCWGYSISVMVSLGLQIVFGQKKLPSLPALKQSCIGERLVSLKLTCIPKTRSLLFDFLLFLL